jgi:hypothetical protein
MWRLLLALSVIPVTAHAGEEKMNVAIGAGIAIADTPAWQVRFGENIEMVRQTGDGFVAGTTTGYAYWRGADGNGFHIPIGGYAGVRSGIVTTTLGAGVGVLAIESWHGDAGFGVVPDVAATLGFALDDVRSVTIDARMSRHVLAGCPDFTTWGVLLMIGRTLKN